MVDLPTVMVARELAFIRLEPMDLRLEQAISLATVPYRRPILQAAVEVGPVAELLTKVALVVVAAAARPYGIQVVVFKVAVAVATAAVMAAIVILATKVVVVAPMSPDPSAM
jgi:hypothetical protein